jgi:hypothetical protein
MNIIALEEKKSELDNEFMQRLELLIVNNLNWIVNSKNGQGIIQRFFLRFDLS